MPHSWKDEHDKLKADVERLRIALESAPRPMPMDSVLYMDWFFQTRIAALTASA